jgi:LmbE family N-acetylglucosaminyl deacetylase
MKPIPNSAPDAGPLVAFGAHPDDIEFGCGGVVAAETRAGRPGHFVVCSHGEAATNGTADQRTREAEAGAAALGAKLEFLELDGDAHLEIRVAHVVKLAAVLRRVRPSIVLAPSVVENQHPDHARLGTMVRDAARLARYGGVEELKDAAPHSIDQLFFYAVTPEGEPTDRQPMLVDVSAPDVLATWTRSMEAHVSQSATRDYVELQLARARVWGLRAGVGHAVPIFPNDPLVVQSLSQLGRAARQF